MPLPTSQLQASQVAIIKSLALGGMPQLEIASHLNVSPSTISRRLFWEKYGVSKSTKVVTEEDNFRAIQDYTYQREMLYVLRWESSRSICAILGISRYRL